MQPTDPNPSISPSTGERRTEMTMTQTDLTARIDEQLKPSEGHTAGPWHVSDRVGEQVIVRTASGQGVVTSLNRDEDHPDAALIAFAPTLRALLVESAARIRNLEAQIAAQAEALAAERERANILAWNNDGHAEWMTEHHQDLQRELPDSETTAQLGRLLARWQRTPGQRQYVALSEVEGQREARELEKCAFAYRQAVEPLSGLRKAEGEAYSRMVDDR